MCFNFNADNQVTKSAHNIQRELKRTDCKEHSKPSKYILLGLDSVVQIKLITQYIDVGYLEL